MQTDEENIDRKLEFIIVLAPLLLTHKTDYALCSPHVFQNARLYIYHMHRVKAMFKEIHSQSSLCHHTLTTHHSHFLQLIKMNLHMALVGKPTALDEIVVPPATLTPNMCHCSSQCSLLVNSRPVNQFKNSLTHEVHPWSSGLIVILAYASIMVFHGCFCLTKAVKKSDLCGKVILSALFSPFPFLFPLFGG